MPASFTLWGLLCSCRCCSPCPDLAGEVGTESAAIDVEIVPGSPPARKTEPESEQTSALPSTATAGDAAAGMTPGKEAETADPPLGPAAEPKREQENAPLQMEPEQAESEEPENPKAAAKSSKPIAAKPARKTVAARRTAKPSAHRAAKKDKKIAPFNGALTGLFSPGAPAKRR
jgi:hypothetical protein